MLEKFTHISYGDNAMTTSASTGETLELLYASDTDTVYALTRHILHSPDFPPCNSYTLTVKKGNETVILDDLTVLRDKAFHVAKSFFDEKVLPENVPFIVEDLLADELFVC
jgi:hypothetical protein